VAKTWQSRGDLGQLPNRWAKGKSTIAPRKNSNLAERNMMKWGWSLGLKTPTGGGDPVGVVEYD
jgi:hypothetical protein